MYDNNLHINVFALSVKLKTEKFCVVEKLSFLSTSKTVFQGDIK